MFMNKLNQELIIKKKQEAYSFFKNFNFSKTIELLNDVIQEDKSKDPACYFLLGTSYIHKRDLDLAEKNLIISFDLDENFYDTVHNLGIVFRLKGNISEAIKFFQKALKLDFNNLGTLNHLAECYEINKSFEDAKKIYLEVIEIDKKNKIANKGLSRICIKFGYHKQGIEYLQKSAGLLRFNDKKYEIIE